MRRETVLFAVVGSVVGVGLAMVAGSFSPLLSYAWMGGIVGATLAITAGSAQQNGQVR